MDFVRYKGEKDYKNYSWFGGHYSGGISLGCSAPSLTSREGKTRARAKFGNADRVDSGDGKVTWQYTFSHPDAPGVFFTLYDWKGGISCGFGIANLVLSAMTRPYAEKLNRMLAELVNIAYR